MADSQIKIVHIITRFNVGGTATWLSTLVQQFAKHNHSSFILAGIVSEGEKEDSRFLERNGIRIRTLSKGFNPFADVLAFLQIRRIVKHLSPDIVNTHTSKAGAIGRLAAWSLGSKRPRVVHTFHGHLLEGYFSKIRVRLIILIEKFLEIATDFFLFSGEKVKRDLNEVKIATSKPSQLVRPGVYTRNSKLVKNAKKSKDSFVIGWLGRFEEVKRPDLAVELSKRMPQLEFRFGGSGSLHASLVGRVGANAKFLGWVNSDSFWDECDIAILTSVNEAMPFSLLEAQSIGIPVITFEAGSAAEVVEDGKTGFVVKDIGGMERAIKSLCNSPELYSKMSQASRDFISQAFSPERMYKEHEASYRKALKTGSKR